MPTEIWAVILVISGGLVGSLGPIFLKLGSASFNRNILAQTRNYKLLLGVLLYALSSLFFIPALKGGELSVLYPLVSLTYVWVSLLSMFILQERMNLVKWQGIIFILVGVFLIGLGS